MNYIIYCRKSSEDDSKQIQSLETQQSLLADYAKRADLNVVDTLHELRSAKNDNNRPLFNSMLAKIENGEIDGILVAHIDRLSRNGIESAKIIKLFEQGLLKEIRTPSRIFNSVQDLLYMDFDFVFASHYSRNLSIRVKEGMKTKLKKGEYPGQAPLGYLNNNKNIYPDPEIAPLVKKAFELYASGKCSLKEIVEEMYELGFRSKAGKKIRKSTYDRMLKNPAYIGKIRYAGKIYEGIHTPIISEELFNAVKEVNLNKTRPKPKKYKFLYRGFVFCEVCGCMYTATIKKSKYKYYYCTNGKHNCDEHKSYMKDNKVEEVTQGIFDNISDIVTSDIAELSLEAYKNSLLDSVRDKKTSLKNISKSLSRIETKKDKLLDLLLEEKITQEAYDRKLKDLESEEKKLNKQSKRIKGNKVKNTLELLDSFKIEAISLSKVFEEGDDQVKQDLLNSALWNFSVKDKKVAKVRYKTLYQKLINASLSGDFTTWLPGRDSNPDLRVQSAASLPLDYRAILSDWPQF